MTGAEWAQLADRLRNDEDLHRRVIEAFQKRGMTRDEAETRYARVADVAEIAAIPESQRTEAQTATFEKAKADPAFRQDLSDIERFASKKEVAAKSDLQSPSASAPNEAAQLPAEAAPTAKAATVAPAVNVSGPGF